MCACMRACVCVPLSVCFHETAVTSSRVPSKVVSSQNALPKVWSVHRIHYQRSVQFTECITKGLVSSQNALPKVCSVHRMHYQRSVRFTECITKGLFSSQNALPKVCSVHKMYYQKITEGLFPSKWSVHRMRYQYVTNKSGKRHPSPKRAM